MSFWKQPATNCSVVIVAIIASVISVFGATALVLISFGVLNVMM